MDGYYMSIRIFVFLYVEILLLKDMSNVILTNILKNNLDVIIVNLTVKINVLIVNLENVMIVLKDGNWKTIIANLIVEIIQFKVKKSVMIWIQLDLMDVTIVEMIVKENVHIVKEEYV